MTSFLRRHRAWIMGLALLAPCLWFASAHGAHAQGVTANELLPGEVGTTIGTGTTDIRVTIARIIRVALGLLGTIALLLILYAGFLWMTAAGDDGKVQRAKQTLSAAIIGLVIILSAFAITQFVLNALVSATTQGETLGGEGGAGGGGGFGGGGAGGGFRPTAIQPKGSLAKYDVLAAVTFSAAPTSDAANIKDNLLLEKVVGGTRTPVSYDPIVENNTIRLQPTQACPAPNAAKRCLEPNQDYQITVRAGLKNASSSDPRTVNCGIGANCTQSFKTGATVATGLPTVSIASPTDGASVPAGDLIALQSISTDENGIASVDYSADGAFFASDGALQQVAPSTYSSRSVWDTNGITPVKTVTLTARATNIDGDSASSAPIRVTVRPVSCFNTLKDADETAIDCGGSCGACTGGSCTTNTACGSGQCVNGRCVENPQITDVQLRDGKPGNLVTVTGRHFGSQSGKVTFLGAAASGDEKDAALASCSGAWSDSRIVIAAPSGAVTGPIQVSVAGGAKKDATNDAFGPIITDFQINDTARPGVCSVAPASVKTGQSMTVTGIAFGAAQGDSRVQLVRAAVDCSQIQDWSTAAEAPQVSPWSDASVQPIMPNVDTGTDGANYLLRMFVGGQPSNSACVRAEPPSAGTEPHIDFLTPDSGSVGTYVTILGSNFGAGGTVRFKNAAGEAVGDVSFPAQCAANYWTTTSVTFKVPAKFTTPANTTIELGTYSLTAVRSDGRSSNAASFKIDTTPVPPGICRIDPNNGPVGTSTTLYGEGFGDIAQGDLQAFLSQHPDAVTYHDAKNAASLGQWRSTQVTAVVPPGAVTGPVNLKRFSGAAATVSNGINFQVNDCRQTGGDASCGGGRSCCDDGSCRASCKGPSAAGGFAWQFATGPIPVFPVVIENATCQISPPTAMPSPNPYKGAQSVCTDIGAMAVRFSLPMDPATVNASNVTLEACGTGAAIGSTCTAVAAIGAPQTIAYDPDGRTLMNLSIGGLQADTWYRLTLKDRMLSLGTPDRPAQPLDGDFDGKAGGKYVTTFKTSSAPCTLAGVRVDPAKGLIAAANEKEDYLASPLSDRCIILSCEGRSVSWSSSDTSKATVAPASAIGQCQATATPVSETDPGPLIHVMGTVDTKSDQGELTIDYANPRVVEYGPRDCTVACINTVAFAYFNTPMSVSGAGSVVSAANANLYECRNESCLAFVGQVPVAPDYEPVSKLLTFGNSSLKANTFYRVVVSGSVMSTSQAPLTGLNYDANAFSWIFRTRTDANPCGPQKVTVSPVQTTLRYIGEVAPITALPISSPDKCSANGEILSSSSYNWAWTKVQQPVTPSAFRFLPDVPPGSLLNTNPSLPAGCSSSCLMTGSEPPGTPACDNGSVEKGEACDTPGLNGCNANCLRTGNTASNGCGDGAVQADLGEECDAGADNGKETSGCSTACLWVGSTAGVSACGNGSVGVGEACDDGNTDNGDGCSSNCLLEGSQQNVYVCGNAKLEPGEECDYQLGVNGLVSNLLLPNHAPVAPGTGDERNPTKPGFACSPSCLLRGNTTSCVGSGCCGNGLIDFAKGEGCDAGKDNGQPGSGCSTSCTKTGASPELRAFCGDTFLTVKPFDPSGAENGGGEECEATSLDANIDATQVVEGRNQCDAKNSCAASVTAAVSSVNGQPIPPVAGQGGVSVECACRDDGDCSAFGSNLSCGAGACCYPRPAAPDIKPKGGDECRNAQISVTFGEEMDVGSLQGNLVVEACGPIVMNGRGGSWLARLERAIGDFFRSLVGTRASAAGACAPIEGAFTHVKDVTPAGTRMISAFAPKTVFDPKRTYRVTVKGGTTGVKTVKGVGYPAGGDTVQEFSTGTEICSFDLIQNSPSTELLQASDDVLSISATALTHHNGRLQPISPVAGTYDWTWSWTTVPEATPPGSLLTLTAGTDPSATVQANKGQNGQEQVLAIAKITSDTLFDPTTAGKQLLGKSDITILLCERPWPARDTSTGVWAPYVDAATHFEFFYCRDNGDAAPLPELQAQPVQGQSGVSGGLLRFCQTTRDGITEQPKACTTNADCGGDTCLSKDLFFQFNEAKLNDAIGVRVYDNADRLTPQAWYRSQHFSGSTQAVNVDGYGALKDTRTVYAGAVDKYGDPTLRSYVYVFAFNDKADPRTSEIFDRLIKNVRFNTNLVASDKVVNVCKDGTGTLATAGSGSSAAVACSSDLDCFNALTTAPAGLHCDSDKDKIRRDLRRWQDIRDIEEALEKVHDGTGFYPKLESGSFVRGFTTSKWPSWSQQMGAAGSIADPLNAFNRCAAFGSECALSGKSCGTDADCAGGTGDVCRPKFEDATCYDEGAGIFACPAASHAYQYRSIGGVDYRMSVDLEYTAYPWEDSDCAAHADGATCDAAIGCSWLPSGSTSGVCQTRVTMTPVCSGLPSDATNKCMKTGVACADSSQCGAQDHCVPTTVPLIGPAVSASCGNGLLEVGEECEVGQQRNQSCASGGVDSERCDSSCQWQTVTACPGAAACGNGSLESFAGESCDDGAQTGQYGRCRSGSFGCAKRCANITVRAATDFVASRDIGGICNTNADCAGLSFSSVCTDRHAFCGDGRKTGPEVCDDGAKNGQYGFCAWDCRGAGPRCGDNVTNGSEQCDGDRSESSGVCIDATSALADNATMQGAAAGCNKDADCGAGLKCAICAPTATGLPQTRSKGCFPATAPAAQACTFDNWSACKQSGACGNGKVEGSEECDAGSANSVTGACLPSCKKNVCNDGFLLPGVEQCDNGAADGVLCTPRYGLTCNYCKTDCSIETVSGAFCGDKSIQSPPESCDPGPVTAWCSRTYTDPADPSRVKGCATNNDCLPGVCRNYPGAVITTALAPSPTRLVRRGSGLSRAALAAARFVGDAALAPLGYGGTLNQLASFHTAPIGTSGLVDGGTSSSTPDTIPPTIGSIVVTPSAPTTSDAVNLSAPSVTDTGSMVAVIKISLTINGVKVLKQTCNFSPAQSPANCAVDVGPLPEGTHVVTVDADDAVGNASSATQSFTVAAASATTTATKTADTSTRAAAFSSTSTTGSSGSTYAGIPAVCGDGFCVATESAASCPQDCTPCWSSSDCSASQFCQGGEGQCTPYNVQCRPEPYSNTKAATDAPNYFDGSCTSCTNACGSSTGKSPAFCGDSVVQKRFGEQCEGLGDANATGPSGSGSYYGCSGDCSFDSASGYCGDGTVQPGTSEACDGTDYTAADGNGSAPTCSSQGWGVTGAVACSRSCKPYGGGCSDGPLSPGDVRIRVTWDNPPDVNDIDTHLTLPSSGSNGGISYLQKGSVTQDPHVWLSWDDTGANQGDNGVRDGFAAPYGMEILTINWRSNGAYWPSSAGDPYTFFLHQYNAGSNGLAGAKVTVCTYDAAKTNNADCSRVFTAGANGTNRYWHVFDLYGGADAIPNFTTVNRFSAFAP